MRNIIEKFQRLDQIREQYAAQILSLAETQLNIHEKVLKELKLGSYGQQLYNGEERYILNYGFLQIEEGGSVGLWEYGRCGDGDSHLTSICIDKHIINGDVEGYEKHLRAKYAEQANLAEIAIQKQKEAQREKLQKDILRMNEELNKLGGTT